MTRVNQHLNNKMNWADKIIKKYKSKYFRILRLRFAFFLLDVTQAQISEILVLV